MSAPAFNKRVWGRPNPARWRARREAELREAAVPAEPEHGHQEHACDSCPTPSSCDCPCETCIRSRHILAGTACATCGSREEIVEGTCANCCGDLDMEESCTCPCTCRPPGPSWIQRQLDEERAAANFAGPGCPYCDAYFTCDCQARRSEMIQAEYRRQERERRTVCTCCHCCTCGRREPETCPACDSDGHSSGGHCDDCGAPAGQPCHPRCGEREEEDHDDDYGCPGCNPGCYGCNPYFDPADPWGDGAPEEHRDDDW